MKRTISIIAIIALVTVLAFTLVACMPTDPKDAEKNLQNAGFETFVIESGSIEARSFALLVEGFDSMVLGSDGNDGIILFYFDDSNSAKDFYADGEESMLALFEISEEDLGDEDFEFKQSGKIVYFGSENGIKAAK